MTESTNSATRQIARAAGVVMAAFILSNLMGLVRELLVGRAFGTSSDLDAFKAAARIPELIFNLVAGGALASAFLPIFTSFLTRKEKEKAWYLASSIANLLFCILTILGVIVAILAEPVTDLLVPGFDPQQKALTASLLRTMMPSVVIFGLSGLLMGVLNSHQVFLIPALAPMMNSVGMIIGVLFITRYLNIYGMAWGMNLGAVLHLLIQLPALFKLKGKYTFSLGLKFDAVRQVGIIMAPRLIGVGIVQLNFVVNTIIASGQPEGSLAGISYAFVLMMMPQAAIAQSIAIAALPTFSAQVALNKLDEMRAALAKTLRGVLLLSFPASLGLIILREPIVAFLYQRGAFDAKSTNMVAWALLWYAAGLVGHSVVEIVSRAFYALHDTKTPVLVGSVAMGLNVVFSLLFSALFERIGWLPHGGLALANSLATALEMVGLLVLMRRRLKGLEGSAVLSGLWQAIGCTLAMLCGLVVWVWATPAQPAWLVTIGGIVLGTLIYGIGGMLIHVPEFFSVIAIIRGRLSRISAKPSGQ